MKMTLTLFYPNFASNHKYKGPQDLGGRLLLRLEATPLFFYSSDCESEATI